MKIQKIQTAVLCPLVKVNNKLTIHEVMTHFDGRIIFDFSLHYFGEKYFSSVFQKKYQGYAFVEISLNRNCEYCSRILKQIIKFAYKSYSLNALK